MSLESKKSMSVPLLKFMGDSESSYKPSDSEQSDDHEFDDSRISKKNKQKKRKSKSHVMDFDFGEGATADDVDISPQIVLQTMSASVKSVKKGKKIIEEKFDPIEFDNLDLENSITKKIYPTEFIAILEQKRRDFKPDNGDMFAEFNSDDELKKWKEEKAKKFSVEQKRLRALKAEETKREMERLAHQSKKMETAEDFEKTYMAPTLSFDLPKSSKSTDALGGLKGASKDLKQNDEDDGLEISAPVGMSARNALKLKIAEKVNRAKAETLHKSLLSRDQSRSGFANDSSNNGGSTPGLPPRSNSKQSIVGGTVTNPVMNRAANSDGIGLFATALNRMNELDSRSGFEAPLYSPSIFAAAPPPGMRANVRANPFAVGFAEDSRGGITSTFTNAQPYLERRSLELRAALAKAKNATIAEHSVKADDVGQTPNAQNEHDEEFKKKNDEVETEDKKSKSCEFDDEDTDFADDISYHTAMGVFPSSIRSEQSILTNIQNSNSNVNNNNNKFANIPLNSVTSDIADATQMWSCPDLPPNNRMNNKNNVATGEEPNSGIEATQEWLCPSVDGGDSVSHVVDNNSKDNNATQERSCSLLRTESHHANINMDETQAWNCPNPADDVTQAWDCPDLQQVSNKDENNNNNNNNNNKVISQTQIWDCPTLLSNQPNKSIEINEDQSDSVIIEDGPSAPVVVNACSVTHEILKFPETIDCSSSIHKKPIQLTSKNNIFDRQIPIPSAKKGGIAAVFARQQQEQKVTENLHASAQVENTDAEQAQEKEIMHTESSCTQKEKEELLDSSILRPPVMMLTVSEKEMVSARAEQIRAEHERRTTLAAARKLERERLRLLATDGLIDSDDDDGVDNLDNNNEDQDKKLNSQNNDDEADKVIKGKKRGFFNTNESSDDDKNASKNSGVRKSKMARRMQKFDVRDMFDEEAGEEDEDDLEGIAGRRLSASAAIAKMWGKQQGGDDEDGEDDEEENSFDEDLIATAEEEALHELGLNGDDNAVHRLHMDFLEKQEQEILEAVKAGGRRKSKKGGDDDDDDMIGTGLTRRERLIELEKKREAMKNGGDDDFDDDYDDFESDADADDDEIDLDELDNEDDYMVGDMAEEARAARMENLMRRRRRKAKQLARGILDRLLARQQKTVKDIGDVHLVLLKKVALRKARSVANSGFLDKKGLRAKDWLDEQARRAQKKKADKMNKDAVTAGANSSKENVRMAFASNVGSSSKINKDVEGKPTANNNYKSLKIIQLDTNVNAPLRTLNSESLRARAYEVLQNATATAARSVNKANSDLRTRATQIFSSTANSSSSTSSRSATEKQSGSLVGDNKKSRNMGFDNSGKISIKAGASTANAFASLASHGGNWTCAVATTSSSTGVVSGGSTIKNSNGHWSKALVNSSTSLGKVDVNKIGKKN